jgi:hypothetical protein
MLLDAPSQATPSVLFIGGHNRSGSTLLSRLLNKQPSVMAVGELTFISDRGLQENQLCSCGKPFRSCDFWAEVVTRVARRSPQDWFARLTELKRNIARIRYVPALSSGHNHPPKTAFWTQAGEYVDMLGEVISAVAAVADVKVVVDSSKHPPYGFFLSRSNAFELYPVHLVRDCRAVAFSQQRIRVRPEIYWTTTRMPRFSPARTAFDWTLFNSLMHLLGTASGRYRRVRYEDIVTHPDEVTGTLLAWAGADAAAAPSDSVGEHQLSGNPMRMRRDFEVTPDTEWLSRMPARDKLAATALSAPLLLAYGYKLRAQPSRQPARPAFDTPNNRPQAATPEQPSPEVTHDRA